VLKAEDGAKRLKAQQRLAESEKDLNWFTVLPIGPAAAMEFNRLRREKPLRAAALERVRIRNPRMDSLPAAVYTMRYDRSHPDSSTH
jgi:hypothetical protein